ncbi:MAG: hypothetical protein IJG81_02005 [Muribaculaceae bacterium]|nr:hypothetical protein [Muribaculaceae bacterium]
MTLKLNFMLFAAIAVMMTACNKNDEIGDDVITRVQDGNGKVFLEKGILVDANLDYTQSELEDALSQHEWEREYCFYYDNSKVSDRVEIGGLPIIIHTNGTIEYDFGSESSRFRDLSIFGKRITATMIEDFLSSTYYPPLSYTIVSLDITDDGGRIVMDYKEVYDVDGFRTSSLYARMVWKMKVEDINEREFDENN